MILYLDKNGNWIVNDAGEPAKPLKDLPDIVRKIVSMALVMLPPWESYDADYEMEIEEKIERMFDIESDNEWRVRVDTGHAKHYPTQYEPTYKIQIKDKVIKDN